MAQQLTIVMAQLNFLVGDIDGNTDLVIASAQRAITEKSADMIVFPELTLVGYPPEDLLLRPSLQVRVEKALAKILAANLDIFLVLGSTLRFRQYRYFSIGSMIAMLLRLLPLFDHHQLYYPVDPQGLNGPHLHLTRYQRLLCLKVLPLGCF